jgi:hypothetical protein
MRRFRLAAAALSLASAVALAADNPQAHPAKVKLFVNALTPAGGVSPELAGALTDAIATEISARGYFETLSARDVETIVGAARQRQLMGCSEEGTSCLAELVGAVGARFMLTGTVAKLGAAYQLTIQTMDTTKAQPLGRATRIANDLAGLRATLPWAVAEATSTPLPAPPSRVLPYSLLTGGGVAFLGGALATFDSISRESALARQLEMGKTDSIERGIGLGIGAAAFGLYVMPPPTQGSIALLPTANGAMIAGVLP